MPTLPLQYTHSAIDWLAHTKSRLVNHTPSPPAPSIHEVAGHIWDLCHAADLRPGGLPHLLHSRELLLAWPGSQHCKLTALHMLAAQSVYQAMQMLMTWPCSGVWDADRLTVSVRRLCKSQSLHSEKAPDRADPLTRGLCSRGEQRRQRRQHKQLPAQAQCETKRGAWKFPKAVPLGTRETKLSVGRGLLWAQSVQQAAQVHNSQGLRMC